MTRTLIPFPVAPAEVTAQGVALLDAARAWRRLPSVHTRFPESAVRQLGATGLLGALTPLDALMVVIAANSPGHAPFDLGPVGTPLVTSDARLLAWALGQAVRDGTVSEDALDRLALRLDIGAGALLGATLRWLACATRPRVLRAAWPEPMPMTVPADDIDMMDVDTMEMDTTDGAPNWAARLAAE